MWCCRLECTNNSTRLRRSWPNIMSALYNWTNREGNRIEFNEGFSLRMALIMSGCRAENSITDADVKKAADCMRKLGYEPDKNQIRESGGKIRKWRKISNQD